MIDLVSVQAWVAALTGSPDTVMDWRAIHDVDKGRQAIPMRGTAAQVAAALDQYQASGYGIFAVVNELDGTGGLLASNVSAIRAQFIDYDVADTNWSQFHAVSRWQLPPTFYVAAAIPGKFHAYWVTNRYADDGRFETTQRKLVALWNSDRKPIDPPRVMRVPGSVHLKDPTKPVMVTMVPGSGVTYQVTDLQSALINVEGVAGGGAVERHDLGDAGKVAPSFEWAVYALNKIDPGALGRDDWLKISAAFKAAAWIDDQHAEQARAEWDKWCARYPDNDLAENDKLWRSVRDTKTGWSYLEKVSGVKVERMFSQRPTGPLPAGAIGDSSPSGGEAQQPGQPAPVAPGATDPSPKPPGTVSHGSAFLTPSEQIGYFNGCVIVESLGRILTPSGRLMDSTKFNAAFGGPVFILDQNGEKTTDEPWKAATRGQVFKMARVDHLRFMPTKPIGEIMVDEFDRRAVNTYIPAKVVMKKGDVTPFLNHLAKLMPVERDRMIFLNYLRHCVQRPGVKAFWACLLQSSEGAGKGVFKHLMTYALGGPYVYAVNARELGEGGGKFNGWMSGRLMIIADEIKVDDKRDMVEVLKPMITEARIEIQRKGQDQEVEDNVANWLMFTNYKDAVPIGSNDRRYAIFYLAIQSVEDIKRLGMDGDYFPTLYKWLYGDGAAFVTYWLKHSSIDPEFDPAGAAHRAPVTSSTEEAIEASRGPIEQLIMEAVASNRPGFRGGWLSSSAVQNMLKEDGRKASHSALGSAMRNLQYKPIGRAPRAYFEEEMKQPNLWSIHSFAQVATYGADQGYRGD